MKLTLEQILTLPESRFDQLSQKDINAIMGALKDEKKNRIKSYIKPLEKKYIKPIKDKFIKPKQDEFIAPIDKILKKLKTRVKSKPVYIVINGNKVGPFDSKKDIMDLIEEDEE